MMGGSHLWACRWQHESQVLGEKELLEGYFLYLTILPNSASPSPRMLVLQGVEPAFIANGRGLKFLLEFLDVFGQC